MSNLTIVSQIESRIAELRRELALLEGARSVLTGPAAKKLGIEIKGVKAKARASTAEVPAGTFNLLRPEVLACLAKRPSTTRDMVTILAKKKKATLDSQGQRVMWARIHQHLLQLEGAGLAKRNSEGWMRTGK